MAAGRKGTLAHGGTQAQRDIVPAGPPLPHCLTLSVTVVDLSSGTGTPIVAPRMTYNDVPETTPLLRELAETPDPAARVSRSRVRVSRSRRATVTDPSNRRGLRPTAASVASPRSRRRRRSAWLQAASLD
jgi:hypothetical protein